MDVNRNDFNISIDAIERAITAKTKVIIPVDFAGYPCDYDFIYALLKHKFIAAKFNPTTKEQETLGRIMVLSDAAHSIGAIYKGRKTGCLADVTVFSFHAVKNLTTAEGGAIALNLPPSFNNESVYRELCIKSLHGQNKDALEKTKGGWKYDVIEAGYKCNMTDIAASIGLIELERYDETLKKRKYIFEKYTDAFAKYSWALIPEYFSKDKISCYHLYALRIKGITEQQRDLIINRIFADNVSVNVHFIPVPMMSFYQSLGYKVEDFQVSFENYACEISLPVYYDLSNDEIQKVIEVVSKSVEEYLNKII